MARNFTVTLVTERAKKRGGYINDTSIPDADWYEYISASYAWLWEQLADAGVLAWSTQTINADGTKDYTLPADFFRSLGVQYQYATNYWTPPLPKIHVHNLNEYDRPNGSQAEGWYNDGTSLILLPAPPSGQVYRHLYYAAAPDLTSGSQSIDGISGWEEFLVIDAALKARIKDKEDTSDLFAERQVYLDRIEMAKASREMNATARAQGLFEDEVGRIDPADWIWWPGGA